MMNWKVVKRIANAAGIVSIVFAIISAVLTYNIIRISYALSPPVDYVQMTILSGMLPYLFYAIVAFTVSAFASRSAKEITLEQSQLEIQPHSETLPSEPAP